MPGVLPPNTIYFTDGTFDPIEARSINPDATGNTLLATITGTFTGYVMNAVKTHEVIFGNTPVPFGGCGVYRNSTLSASGAVQIVAPQFDNVSFLQVTPDGNHIVFIGSLGTTSTLYKAAIDGSTLVAVDSADTCALSPDGTTVVYSNGVSGSGEIFTCAISPVGTPVRLTNNSFDDLYPQYSKDGTAIVFSSDRDQTNASTPYDLYIMSATGTNVQRLTNSPTVSEFGASFSPDGAKIAYAGIGDTAGTSGIFTISASAAGNMASRFTLLLSDNIGNGTYWSSAQGRFLALPSSSGFMGRLRRHR